MGASSGNDRMKAVRTVLRGVATGGLPGLVLVGVSVPVSGEAELTLGALGGIAALIGAVSGGIAAFALSRDRTDRT